jgi:hypothetical protein
VTRDAFAAMFADVVFRPAVASGFRFVGKGQTIAHDAGAFTAALIRLGGRFARPGSIAHVFCGRHRFLRELTNLEVPRDTTEVFDHPYKFVPSELKGRPITSWRYIARNLSYEYDRIEFDKPEPEFVRSELEELQGWLIGPVRQWAATLTPEKAAHELHTNGTNAWCERVWLDDYAEHVAQAERRRTSGCS